MNSQVLSIRGMTCAACAQRIEKTIGKLDGVSTVSVNFATEKATVAYNPQQIRVSSIKEAVEKAGYKALEVSKTDAADEDRVGKQKEIRILWTKFIVAAALALPLLYIAMAPMLEFVKLPFPAGLDPMTHPLL